MKTETTAQITFTPDELETIIERVILEKTGWSQDQIQDIEFNVGFEYSGWGAGETKTYKFEGGTVKAKIDLESLAFNKKHHTGGRIEA